MTETICEYFKRFDTSVTESVYTHYTLADYHRSKAVNEYLDYDRESLFRKGTQYCGIRNIDNSCYLSVTLQILYNIQGLREKIYRIPQEKCSKFMTELQKLFAMMSKGSLIYVDPTNVFNILKKLYPSVFISGDQNDFHEVFTIILDELEKGLEAEEDKRFLRKLFYGKTKIQLFDDQKNIVNGNDPGNLFSLINLSSENKTLDNALREYRRESIEGYMNEKGIKVNAQREIHFIETPGILSFFVNRVSYKDKKLHKDCSQFEFDDKIFFNKTNVAKLGKNSDHELERQTKVLASWIDSITNSKDILLKSLEYFQGKEFNDVNVPSIENPLGEQAKENTKKFIKGEIQQIDKKILAAQKQMDDIQKKREKMAEDNYSQLYQLWAVMIHTGKNAQSGHYKMCIKVDEHRDSWVQFNDRRTDQVPSTKIEEYKKKGDICCLFYKRSTLVCRSEKCPIPINLKKMVKEEEMQIFKNIDNARLLQALYQEYESANIIWEFENISLRQQEKTSTYFFKPLLHLLMANVPQQTCKGYLLYEIISNPKFLDNLKDKFLDPCRQIEIPKLNFKIPSEYFELSDGLKEFIRLELVNPVQAYELISFYMDISINDKILKQMFERVREVIILKGIFYEGLFLECGWIEQYENLSKSLGRILSELSMDDPCTLVSVPLRQQLNKIYEKKMKKPAPSTSVVPKLKRIDSSANVVLKENLPLLFAKRFGFWIKRREKMIEIDETLLKDHRGFFKEYVEGK